MDGKSAGLRLHGYLSDILAGHERKLTHPLIFLGSDASLVWGMNI
jgi:hypothetical protein